MPIVLTIGRHLAESCPEFNEKTRKIFLEYMSKREELLKKHGVKELGNWSVGAHQAVMVFEAQSADAIAKFRSEPEYVALNAFETTEVKTAITNEEVAKKIKAKYPYIDTFPP